jgi:hypothetical protein
VKGKYQASSLGYANFAAADGVGSERHGLLLAVSHTRHILDL